MESIIGVLSRTGLPLSPDIVHTVCSEIADEKSNKNIRWKNDHVVIVQTQNSNSTSFATNRDVHNRESAGIKFFAIGRVDNGEELCNLLGIPLAEYENISDYEIMRRAYVKWGNDSAKRIYGDWVFAAWKIEERQLTICRGHYSLIPLYYHIDSTICAFATSRKALLKLNLVPVELNELWLGQYLIAWHAYFGDSTPYKSIYCLPPAHCLTIDHASHKINRYWHPVDNPELKLSSREEYVEVFQEIFDEAVRCRLKGSSSIAATLSGGLDSGAVAATAAQILAERGQRLTAFTSVPDFDPKQYLASDRFGDEFPFAQATAAYSGNIDLYSINSSNISPIAGIRRVLNLGQVPVHAALNLYWMISIREASLAAGCNVLLTGAAGNGGISWRGYATSQPLSFLLSHLGWRAFMAHLNIEARKTIKTIVPVNLVLALRKYRMEQKKWYRLSAINPDFAAKMELLDGRLQDPEEVPPKNARFEQYLTLKPGRWVVGALNAEISAASGLEVRDPTCDPRVLDFVFSVPDRIFMDPKTGIDRWLIREAMKGRLPDLVRLNQKRGRQSGDIVPRLRRCRDEVEDALNELEQGSAVNYLDISYMRHVWKVAQTKDSYDTFLSSSQILLRGIMAGLFVNGMNNS